jgi:hypothetical protein
MNNKLVAHGPNGTAFRAHQHARTVNDDMALWVAEQLKYGRRINRNSSRNFETSVGHGIILASLASWSLLF